jgi:hypothetical protein
LLVADSGPLIALARLDLLHLPSAMFAGTSVQSDFVVRVRGIFFAVGMDDPRARGMRVGINSDADQE